ncbi:hypothetical protein ACF0H5_015040 [Mactra antiquata]
MFCCDICLVLYYTDVVREDIVQTTLDIFQAVNKTQIPLYFKFSKAKLCFKKIEFAVDKSILLVVSDLAVPLVVNL